MSKPTFGEALADKTSKAIGSWTYMVIQTLFLILWITLNVTAIVRHWDPYPFGQLVPVFHRGLYRSYPFDSC